MSNHYMAHVSKCDTVECANTCGATGLCDDCEAARKRSELHKHSGRADTTTGAILDTAVVETWALAKRYGHGPATASIWILRH